MISIDEILKDMPDKSEYPNTTSKKFKKDLYNYFSDSKFRGVKAMEIGTHRGHTTKLMSHLFDKVITMNINDKGNDWIPTQEEDKNITYFVNDSYSNRPWPGRGIAGFWNEEIEEKFRGVEVIFIDCLREYEKVKTDIANSLELKPKQEKYIIIEDYGNEKFEGVKQAVDEVCWFGHMEIVKGIGYPAGTQHGTMKYNDWEAVICRTLKK